MISAHTVAIIAVMKTNCLETVYIAVWQWLLIFKQMKKVREICLLVRKWSLQWTMCSIEFSVAKGQTPNVIDCMGVLTFT